VNRTLPTGHSFLRVASGHTFEIEARGSGPETLLIHPGGPGMTYPYLGSLLRLASSRRRVLLFNPRGVGESWTPRSKAAYTLPKLASDVEEIRHALALARFDLLGFSAGGFVAIEYARRYPKQLRSLLLCGTAPSAHDIEASNRRMLASAPARTRRRIRDLTRKGAFGDPEYQRLAEQVARPFGQRFLRSTPLAVRRSVVNPVVYRAMITPSGDEFVVGGSLAGWDGRRGLGRLRLPVLVLVGRYDFFHSASRAMAARIPNSQLVVLPRASHLAHLEQPREFRAAVRHFLDGLPA
jgi:proline-specific peptidase